MALIQKKYLPITDKWQYTFRNTAGQCFSAGKGQATLKTTDSIPIFNYNFTEEEYEQGTSIYLKEPNGVTVTKDIVRMVTTRELTEQEITKIVNRIDYVKDNVQLFKG